MSKVKLSPRAYCKMVLHAAKYPHLPVNGILLASEKLKEGVVLITDAVPLFHIGLNLTPMAEIALTQVDSYAASKGLAIVGYYYAAEHFTDVGCISQPHRIVEKISENSKNNTCIVFNLSNSRLTLSHDKPAFLISYCVNGHWAVGTQYGSLEQEKCTLEAASLLLRLQSHEQLVDFDNHLDDPALDWTNPELNEDISKAMDLGEDDDAEEEGEQEGESGENSGESSESFEKELN